MRAGVYVDLLSFFSAASGNPQPITPADAVRVARAQHGRDGGRPGRDCAPLPADEQSRRGVDPGAIWRRSLVVAVAALAVATPALLRRRRQRLEQADGDR